MSKKRIKFILGPGTLALNGIDSNFDGVHSPQGEEEGKGNVEDQVLNLTKRRVVLWIRCPLKQERISRNIFIASLFICCKIEEAVYCEGAVQSFLSLIREDIVGINVLSA